MGSIRCKALCRASAIEPGAYRSLDYLPRYGESGKGWNMNNLNIGEYNIDHVRAGESGYYVPRQRGTIDVWHDSQRWVYEQPRFHPRKAVKNSIVAAFENNGRVTVKITGRWPSYTVTTEY